jgi:hypothetical protein
MSPCSTVSASLFAGGCLLCMPFGSKLLELHLDTSRLHFVAVVNFIIIADKFRKKKNILFYSKMLIVPSLN